MEFLLVAILLALGGAVTWLFNRLIALRNRARGAWSDIDVQLERRHDLIENLEEVVRGYAAHEHEILESVSSARSRAERARLEGNPEDAAVSENRLTGRLGTLFAVAEAYPDLRAAELFLDLQRTLVEVEDALQNARRYYNAVVRDLNTRIQSFPDLLLARPLGFREWRYFELEDPGHGEVPRLDLGGA